jgi:hypothetical protein
MAAPTFAELDELPTDTLRERAFTRARNRRDIAFFWSVFKHLPASDDGGADGSLGVESTVDEAIALWHDSTGHEYGDEEPLLRAAFIDYLLKNGQS